MDPRSGILRHILTLTFKLLNSPHIFWHVAMRNFLISRLYTLSALYAALLCCLALSAFAPTSLALDSLGETSITTSRWYSGTDNFVITMANKPEVLTNNSFFQLNLGAPNYFFFKSEATQCTDSNNVLMVASWPPEGENAPIRILFPDDTDTAPVGSPYTISCTQIKTYPNPPKQPFNVTATSLQLNTWIDYDELTFSTSAQSSSLTFSTLFTNPNGTFTVTPNFSSLVPLTANASFTAVIALSPDPAEMIASTVVTLPMPPRWIVTTDNCAVTEMAGTGAVTDLALAVATSSTTLVPTISITVNSLVTKGFTVMCSGLTVPGYSPAVASVAATVRAYNANTYTVVPFSYAVVGREVGTFRVTTTSPVVTALVNVTARIASVAGTYSPGSVAIEFPTGASPASTFACTTLTDSTVLLSNFVLTDSFLTANFANKTSSTATVSTPRIEVTCMGVLLGVTPAPARTNYVFKLFDSATPSSMLAASNTGIFAGTNINTEFAVKMITTSGLAGDVGTISVQLSAVGVALPVGSVLVFGQPKPSAWRAETNTTFWSSVCTLNNSPRHSFVYDAASQSLVVTTVAALSQTSEVRLECTSALSVAPYESPAGSMAIVVKNLFNSVLVKSALVVVATVSPVVAAVAPNFISGTASLPAGAPLDASSTLTLRLTTHRTSFGIGDSIYFGSPLPNAQTGDFLANGTAAGTYTLVADGSMALVFTHAVTMPSTLTMAVMLPATPVEARTTYLAAVNVGGQRYAASDVAMLLPLAGLAVIGTQDSRVLPYSTVAGADWGLVTFIVRPLNAKLSSSNELRIMVPAAWTLNATAVDDGSFACRASQVAWVASAANVSLVLSGTPVVTPFNTTFALMLENDADAAAVSNATGPLRVFCDGMLRTPSTPTEESEDPMLAVAARGGAVTAQAPDMFLPAFTDSAESIVVVTATSVIVLPHVLKFTQLNAAKQSVADAVGVAVDYVGVQHQALVAGASGAQGLRDLSVTISLRPHSQWTLDALEQQADYVGIAALVAAAASTTVRNPAIISTLSLAPSCLTPGGTGGDVVSSCGSTCLLCRHDDACTTDADCESTVCEKFRCKRFTNAAATPAAVSAAIAALIAVAMLFLATGNV